MDKDGVRFSNEGGVPCPKHLYMSEATSTLIVLKGLEGNQPMHLTPLQLFLQSHIDFLQAFWWTVFTVTLCVAIILAIKNRSNE